jgi:hypothetical protein
MNRADGIRPLRDQREPSERAPSRESTCKIIGARSRIGGQVNVCHYRVDRQTTDRFKGVL